MECIAAEKLTKVYGRSGVPALHDVTLSVNAAQIFTLLGRNGAGKTTFLRIAATQLMPTSGRVRVLGFDVVKEVKKIRERIAVVPQEGRPFEFLTPWDHVYFNLLLRGMKREDARKRAKWALEELYLTEYYTRPSDKLSGGLRQRILVAMALATEAQILFLDEPTLGLDPLARRNIWKILSKLREEGKTILLTTHYLDEAEALSDKIAIIDKGRIVASGTVSELKSMVKENVRVDIANGFTIEELSKYGRVNVIGGIQRVMTVEDRARELASLAIERKARLNISPISLDDIFSELVANEDENR